MPEQLALEQAGGDGGAVHLDEAALATAAQFVNRPRDEFLSRAGLARNENGRIRGGHGLNASHNRLKGRSFANHVPDVPVQADLVLQGELLGGQPLLYVSQFSISERIRHRHGNLARDRRRQCTRRLPAVSSMPSPNMKPRSASGPMPSFAKC